MIEEGQLSAAQLTDMGICPTCFDRENGNCLYGENSSRMIFSNEQFECFLAGNPRAKGHAIISSQKHYKDMMESPDDLCQDVFIFAKKLMSVLKKEYKAESVYLCTMCDGPMNHFHIQLIPRYSYEERGSINFVKKRKKYIEDNARIERIRMRLDRELNRKEKEK